MVGELAQCVSNNFPGELLAGVEQDRHLSLCALPHKILVCIPQIWIHEIEY